MMECGSPLVWMKQHVHPSNVSSLLKIRTGMDSTTTASQEVSGQGTIEIEIRKIHDQKQLTDDGLLELEMLRMLELTRPSTPCPGPKYVCHRCYQKGHFVQDCPNKYLIQTNLSTTYKGCKRSVGEFLCPKCKRKWLSTLCFAGESQACKKCRIDTLPKKMFSFECAEELGKFTRGRHRRLFSHC